MNLDKSDYYPKSNLADDEEASSEISESSEKSELSELSEISEKSDRSDRSDSSDCSDRSDLSDYSDSDSDHSPVTLVANLLSWILVPVLMPVYGIILCFGLTILAFTGFGVQLAFTAITFAFNVVGPAIIVLLLKRFGFISDIGLNNREERFIPYVVSIVALIGTAIFMWRKGAPEWMVMFFMGGAAAGIVEVIVNRWWKISVHAAGIAGIVALLLHLMQFEYTSPHTMLWLMISIGAAGLLGASRIWLGRHTLWQVIAGSAVGFCGVYFIMLI